MTAIRVVSMHCDVLGSAVLGTRRHRRREVTVTANGIPGNSSFAEDDATRKAVLEVVQVWLDRLQLISVIASLLLPL